MTNQVIPIREKEGQQVVDARELHNYLEVGKRFTTWIQDRINDFGFAEGEDYFPNLGIGQNAGNGVFAQFQRRKDYILTLDMAKELAMVERSEKGRQARRYFIEIEKKMRELVNPSPAKLPNIPLASQKTADERVIRDEIAYSKNYINKANRKLKAEEAKPRICDHCGQYCRNKHAYNTHLGNCAAYQAKKLKANMLVSQTHGEA